MSDDEDDLMAANPEPPRIEAAYGDCRGHRKPKRDERGRWVMQWVVDEPLPPGPAPGVKICASCKAEVTILHPLAPDFRRTVCGTCQGVANRDRMQPTGGGDTSW